MGLGKGYHQLYKKYYIWEGLFLVGWIVYFLNFFMLYKEAVFYLDKNARYIVQLLFFITNYPNELLIYLFLAFLLLTANFLLILMLYIGNKRQVLLQKNTNGTLILFLGLACFCSGLLLMNRLWPLFGLIVIFSLTLIYIIYAITKYLYEEDEEVYEVNEVIKVEGPFNTKEEAESYAQKFVRHWKVFFENKGYGIKTMMTSNENDEWLVSFTLITIENTNY